MNKPNQPNGILMADAIMAEARQAHRENRVPCSSKAIAIFQRRTKNKLSVTDAGELFEIVFAEYCRLTGSSFLGSNN